jgi:hypothetical protein
MQWLSWVATETRGWRKNEASTMPPLALSDSELDAIVEAARPLAPRDRAKFVEAVAVELSRCPVIGDGIVGRVVAKVQRQHFNHSPD